MNYEDLRKKPAKEYLKPSNFKTSYDKDDSDAKEQYRTGLRTGSEYGDILITSGSVWMAGNNATTGLTSNHEGIGYHKNTAQLLEGFIDSGAKITVIREGKDGIDIEHIIQQGDQELLDNMQVQFVKQLENEKPAHTIIKLEPLRGRPLMSQVQYDHPYQQLGLCDLEFDKETSSYRSIKDSDDVIFVLSNFDIAQDKIIKDVQTLTSDRIDNNVNVIVLGVNHDKGFVKTEPEILKINNKILTIYPQGKGHHQDIQMAYCEIKRKNNLKKDKKKVMKP